MNNKNRFWQSLEQLQDNRETIVDKKQEFLTGVTDKFDVNKMPEVSRRKFLAALGVSAAFISTSCTDYRDKGEIVTYNNKPENVDYGVANYYASSLNNGYGILIKTREGRPIKVDGNPDHPVNKSKIDNIGQASMLDLYDPGRLKDPKKKTNGKFSKINWKVADGEIIELLNNTKNSNKEIALITGEVISPSQNKLFDDFIISYPNAKIYSYDVFAKRNKLNAWQKAYGDNLLPSYNIDEAKIILALESDFLGADADAVENIQKFAKTRDFEKLDDFSRLYSIEGNLSVTGTNSDYRLRLSPEKQYDFVLALINQLLKKNLVNIELSSDISAKVASYNLEKFATENNLDIKVLNYLVDDLHNNTGKSIVVAGDQLPEAVHSAVFMLNEIIKATELYDLKHRNSVIRETTSNKEWNELINKINSGQVGTIINFDVNPVYNLPGNWNSGEVLKKTKVITFTEQETETSELSDYVLPINHALESWGDFMLREGVISTQQPVISPLYNTRQKEAVLLTWANRNADSYSFDIYHKFVQKRWQDEFYPALSLGFGFKDFWFSVLHDGIFEFDSAKLNGDNYLLNYNADSFVNHLMR
jgi:MoCo/4Fe-4S cofactor protein with predicted Tat translocation signal